MPVGLNGAGGPVTVAVSTTDSPATPVGFWRVRASRMVVVTVGVMHDEKLPNAKSVRAEVIDGEEAVLARKLVKQPWLRPMAVRSTPTSRNSPAAGLVAP